MFVNMTGQATTSTTSIDLRFEAVLERSPAKGGWTFVRTDWTAQHFGTRGRIPVAGTIDGVEFASTFMALGDGTHKLPVTAAIRSTIGKEAGDRVVVHLTEHREA
jgi:hypothetical protein